MTSIICRKCNQEKSKDDYYKNRRICKKCHNANTIKRVYKSRARVYKQDYPIEDRRKIKQLLDLGVSLKRICQDHNFSYNKCLRRLKKNPDYFNV